MRIGIVATLLPCLLASDARAQAAKSPPTLPDRRGPTTYPVLAPAAHWGLRYLARSQHATGGWGHKFGVKQPDVLGDYVQGPLVFERKHLVHPPALVDTSLVVLAFLEAGRSPAAGDGARELRRAIDFVHDAVGPGGHVAPDPRRLPPYVESSSGLHAAGLEHALALEMFLAARDHLKDPAVRRDLDLTFAVLVRRLVSTQQDDGSWPNGPWRTYPGSVLITRALMIAARGGLEVDPAALARARQAALVYHNPATGDVDTATGDDFWEFAASLNILHHTRLNARAAADGAARRGALPGATAADAREARDRAADARAADDALALSEQKFFKKLLKANKPLPQPRAAAVPARALPATRPANPLDAPNPLDNPAAAAAEEKRRVGIPVPVSQYDAVSYFLLLEALQESAHPLARPLTDGVVNALAAKQDRFGQWHHRIHPGGYKIVNHTPAHKYDSEDHFLTAWVVRALLVPAPPESAKP